MLGKEVIGWALLVVAVLLFPVPVIPSILVVCGLLVLSSRYCWAAQLLVKARKILPARIVPVNVPMKNATMSELNA